MDIYAKIKELADKYAQELKFQMEARIEEMKNDDKSHYLLYEVLGIANEQGNLIDIYQNEGRFLYKYAGSFLEEAAFICMQYKYPDAIKIRIPNTLGSKPKTFEIDCLVKNLAHEIKWRDATTDGDHIIKERTRIEVIKKNGYIPVRVMFYYPQRFQARKIQESLESLYKEIGGKYYCGSAAWEYIKEMTDVDLLSILREIAHSRKW